MTKLLWDQTGSRIFETGLDRGVLYLPDGGAVPWNGLLSVTDDPGDVTIEEYFLDGITYLNRRTVSDYVGTLKALTYPDEFEQFDGTQSLDVGIVATGQPVTKTFGLSFRTLVGNDIEGTDFGYKIHLLYNLTAKPDSKSHTTTASSVTPDTFSWSLVGVPIPIANMRPSVHLIIDSTKIDAGNMLQIENFLYGSDTQDPALPTADELVGFQTDLILDPITEPL